MSMLKVVVIKIENVEKHPNADRLDIAWFKDWRVVTQRGNLQVGDLAVYFPIDSILPIELEAKLFGSDSKIKLSNHRIKTIKIRGAISQGMLVKADELLFHPYEGQDVTAKLKVTKYEPPNNISPQSNLNKVRKKLANPYFYKYSDIENFKYHPNLFTPDENVYVTEKIHGSNFRAGWVKFHAVTWWQKLVEWVGLAPRWVFVFGSHNTQLHDPKQLNYYQRKLGKNIYWEMVEKYDLRNKIKPGEVFYGEVYGEGVQKGFMYDCKPNERKIVIIDIRIDSGYIDHTHVRVICKARDLPEAPIDYIGKFDKPLISQLVSSKSNLTKNHLREGIVIKPANEQLCFIGRMILKWKSDEFLLKCEDDTH